MIRILKRLSRKIGISETDKAKAIELEKKAWDTLLISENGDTRGWNPTAYRRLLGYEQTYEADVYATQAIDLLAPEE